MRNGEVAHVLKEMGELMLIQGGDAFRARAFVRAAAVVAGLGEDVGALLEQGRLPKVRGLGQGSLERVKEILQTGTCEEHQRILQAVPAGLRQVIQIRGMGPGTARAALSTLGVTDLPSLERAARDGRLATLPGVGARVQARVLAHLDELKDGGATRLRLDEALAVGARVIAGLRAHPAVIDVVQVGSARRGEETSGDLDFVCSTTLPAQALEHFCAQDGVERVLARGTDRASVQLRVPLLRAAPTPAAAEPSRATPSVVVQADLWVAPPLSFGATVHAFTGDKQHNIRLRTAANQMGLHISEHGVWERKLKHGGEMNRRIARQITPGATEEDIYRALGLPLIPIELRTGGTEIERARAGTLPVLVDVGDLRGFSLDARALEPALLHDARSRGFLWVIARVAAGTRDARAALDAVRRFDGEAGVVVFTAIERTIDATGALDDANAIDVDVVYAAPDDASVDDVPETERLRRAIHAGGFDVLRRVLRRDLPVVRGVAVDAGALAHAALPQGIAFEHDAWPRRFDLDVPSLRAVSTLGAPLVLGTSADGVDEPFGPGQALAHVALGVQQARRAGLGPAALTNTKDVAGMLERVNGWRARRGLSPRGAAPVRPAPSSTPKTPKRSTRLSTHVSARGSSKGSAAPEPAGTAAQSLAAASSASPAALLAAALSAPDAALRARLLAYLGGADDAALHEALSLASANPLQEAFRLLALPPQP